MDIDFDRLRSDLADDSYGAFYGGGFGVALMEAFDIEAAAEDELIQLAEDKGLDLEDYCE